VATETHDRLWEWARNEVVRGALDAAVLERAAMILRVRSRKPDAIITRAVRKVLADMAVKIRAQGDGPDAA